MNNKLFEEGRILVIGERQAFTTKGGRDGVLRMLVLDVGEPLKNGSILHDMKAFTFFNDKTDMLDNFCEDEKVRVYFTWHSSMYNGRYYHLVTGWRIKEATHEEQAKNKTSSRPKDSKNSFWLDKGEAAVVDEDEDKDEAKLNHGGFMGMNGIWGMDGVTFANGLELVLGGLEAKKAATKGPEVNVQNGVDAEAAQAVVGTRVQDDQNQVGSITTRGNKLDTGSLSNRYGRIVYKTREL